MRIARPGLIPIAAAALLGTTAVAYGQPTPPPATPAEVRQGFFVGFSVGAGNMSCETVGEDEVCDGVTEAGGAALHLGTMLRPHLALSGEVWVMGHTEDYVTITNAITTIGIVYWLTPNLWIRGGVGGAVASWQYKGPLGLELGDETESVPAVMGAVGYELKSTPHFAIDIQLRGGTGYYEDEQAKTHNVALAVGFTWY